MKKHIKSILLLLSLSSCQGESVSITNYPSFSSNHFKLTWIGYDGEEKDQYVSVVEIDSCEYLVGSRDRSRFLTHKGNCKYCIARNSQKQP